MGSLILPMLLATALCAYGQDSAPQTEQAASPTPAPATANPVAAASPAPITTAPAAAAPQPMPYPSMAGPLTLPSTLMFDAGPLGKVNVGGVVSGIGMVQGNWVPGDQASRWDLDNGQLFIEKNNGWWQYFIQVGAYNIPDLGAPTLSTSDWVKQLYGPFPQGFLKIQPSAKNNFSMEIGALPTLIGAEYTFDFENVNISRGLLWNQENAVNRGVQLNDSWGHFSGSISWNDGFYSNRYTWLWGSLSYAINPSNTISFVGGGNLGQTKFTTFATPVQNNSQIYNVIYTYTHKAWVINPYFQYTDVPTNAQIGIAHGASTAGGALLLTYNFKDGFSMCGRGEYITSSGNAAENAVNLMYGPGSSAWSLTLTPTYQKHRFFLRAEFGFVDAQNITPGDAFGPLGLNRTQPRGVIESGYVF